MGPIKGRWGLAFEWWWPAAGRLARRTSSEQGEARLGGQGASLRQAGWAGSSDCCSVLRRTLLCRGLAERRFKDSGGVPGAWMRF